MSNRSYISLPELEEFVNFRAGPVCGLGHDERAWLDWMSFCTRGKARSLRSGLGPASHRDCGPGTPAGLPETKKGRHPAVAACSTLEERLSGEQHLKVAVKALHKQVKIQDVVATDRG